MWGCNVLSIVIIASKQAQKDDLKVIDQVHTDTEMTLTLNL